MIYQIFINDYEIDLNPNQIIALTLQANAIGKGELSTRKASFTNSISIPKTKNNVSVLDYSNLQNAVTSFPYVRASCRINANGIEILSGVAIVRGFDTSFNLQIYSLPKDLSIAIGGGVLSDLDFGDSPVTWDAAYIDSRRAATTGFCTPVINYGQVNPTVANGTVSDYYLPCVAYKDIITTIIENAGYTVSGDFYDNDDWFNNMVLTYSRTDWPGTSFKINEILSDSITQADFMKDFVIKFGAFFRIVGLDVEILILDDILNSKTTAVDWTAKRANKKESVKYSWDNWAQSNDFTYPSRKYYVENILSPVRARDGKGSLLNTNVNITAVRKVYQSIFGLDEMPVSTGSGEPGIIEYKVATVSKTIFGATMPVWDGVPVAYEPFDNDPIPMICLLRDPTTVTIGGTPYVESTMRYNGVDRADYKIAYIEKYHSADVPVETIHWSGITPGTDIGFLDRYYATLQTLLTAGVKTITRTYKLNDIDIYSLDLLTPIFDSGDYFLISTVKEYVSGRLTDVELIKI